MSDDADRTGKRAFEPPPWEREQFEELAKRRAAAEQTTTPREPAGSDETRDDEPPAAATSIGRVPVAAPDDKATDAMLLQLSGEERTALIPVRRAGSAAALALGLVGAMVLVFGLVLAWRSRAAGPVGIVGGVTVLVMGAFIAGAGAWLWVRASR